MSTKDKLNKSSHRANQSNSRLFPIWKYYGMRSNPMAALVADSVSEERVKIHKFLLFLRNTLISYRLKNILEPGLGSLIL